MNWPKNWRTRRRDAGFTIVELLVSLAVFAILSAVVLSSILSTSDAARVTKEGNDLNEEARVALNRLVRELRQSTGIVGVTGSDGRFGLRFEADFNGDGVITPVGADPERISYIYDPTPVTGQKVLLEADTGAGLETLPVLAGNVTVFGLDYFSSAYQYDGADGSPPDGKVNWRELDADPLRVVGNGNNRLDSVELQHVDSVTIEITLLQGKRKQNYRTQVDLRNRA